MRFLICLLLGILSSYGVILLNMQFIKWLWSLIPINQWTGLVKIAVLFVDFWFTAGLCILPFLLFFMLGAIIEK